MTKEIKQITPQELSKVENNSLNKNQLSFLFQKTPEKHIFKRPAKGGGEWDYVTGTYVKKVLNLMFGWDWDFEIVEYKFDLDARQAFVLGKLTCRSDGRQIVKMQFGRKDVMFKKDQSGPLDLGNDLKAAATDSLKKCANELGIADDVYSPQEFKEIEVVEEKTLPELLPGTPEWKDAIQGLLNGFTIPQIRKKYQLSDENEAKLVEESL